MNKIYQNPFVRPEILEYLKGRKVFTRSLDVIGSNKEYGMDTLFVRINEIKNNLIDLSNYSKEQRIPTKGKGYSRLVWEITELNAPKVDGINKRNFYRWHLDHIIPISFGFEHNISPLLIGSIENLQVITRDKNGTKGCNLTDKSYEVLSKWASRGDIPSYLLDKDSYIMRKKKS